MAFPSWLPALLGFLTAVVAFSTDMYLPAFPAIEASLGTGPGAAQMTLATWFAGLALGQITQGTLADRYGRRAPLLVGFILYTIGCVGCALAPNIWVLAGFRLLSAIGAAAGAVIPRAVVRDLTDGHAAARMLAQLMIVMAAAPILAPSIGGILLEFWNWRAIFWVFTVYGCISILLVWLVLPETLPEARRLRLSFGELATRYWYIGRERTFLVHALLGAGTMFALFGHISSSSPVFIQGYGYTPLHFGFVFGACAIGLVACGQISPRLLPRLGAHIVVRIGTTSLLLSALCMVVVSFARLDTPPIIIGLLIWSVASLGFITPNAVVGALSRHAAHAGSASALMGTIQFAFGALSGLLGGLFTDGTPRGMAALLLIAGIGVSVADRMRPTT
jgi:DHA1 family bicyclomycin/chloramphenicol resistance-like MFS transporter